MLEAWKRLNFLSCLTIATLPRSVVGMLFLWLKRFGKAWLRCHGLVQCLSFHRMCCFTVDVCSLYCFDWFHDLCLSDGFGCFLVNMVRPLTKPEWYGWSENFASKHSKCIMWEGFPNNIAINPTHTKTLETKLPEQSKRFSFNYPSESWRTCCFLDSKGSRTPSYSLYHFQIKLFSPPFSRHQTANQSIQTKKLENKQTKTKAK